MPNQTDIAFSVGQRAALIAWGAERPLGLGVRVTVDSEEVFEVAKVYHRDTGLALWMLFAVKGGVVVLSGADSDEWETDSVQEALGKVLEQAEGCKALGDDAVSPRGEPHRLVLSRGDPGGTQTLCPDPSGPR